MSTKTIYSDTTIFPFDIFLYNVISLILIRIQRELPRIMLLLQLFANGFVAQTIASRTGRRAAMARRPTESPIEADDQNQEKGEMAVELQSGDGDGEEGEAHLEKPGAVQGEAGGAGEERGGGFRGSDGEDAGKDADGNGDEEEVEVAVFEAVGMGTAEGEEEELEGEGEEGEKVEEGVGEAGGGEEEGKGVEEEEKGDGQELEVEGEGEVVGGGGEEGGEGGGEEEGKGEGGGKEVVEGRGELLREEMERVWAAAMTRKETPASANGKNPDMADCLVLLGSEAAAHYNWDGGAKTKGRLRTR